jgi:single-stranded-DNA-specific exonuclease
MSILGKKWVLKNENPTLNTIAKLLQNRGIDSREKADLFFGGNQEHFFPPEMLKDADVATERIRQAIRSGEKIMVFGDYDVDGITGSALFCDFLKKAGAEVACTLPHREEDGYGLKPYFVDRFREAGVNLILTVDCGTSNYEAIEHAKQMGIDTVVTDHHTMPERLPPAVAVVNPRRADCPYPNKEICGSSIAYKVVSMLAPEFLGEETARDYLEKQLSVVSLGVVGDCMQLVGENRLLLREGLKSLRLGNNRGIKALLESAGIPLDRVDSMTLGFQIGPRINASGRMDTPMHAFELIMGDESKAAVLNALNEQRRLLTEQYIREAVERVDKMTALPNILALHDPNWRAGIIGLVASKMVDLYDRPAIIMQDRGDKLVGSMRSLGEFDITGSLRQEAVPLCEAYGGHEMAGGFTLPKENLDAFLKIVEEVGKTRLLPEQLVNPLHIDCEVDPAELCGLPEAQKLELFQKIRRLGPFGQGNPEPHLLIRNVELLNIRPVGKDGSHLQIPMRFGDDLFSGIAFRFGRHLTALDPSRTYDAVVNLDINDRNGRQWLQFKIVDLKESKKKEPAS